MKQIDAMVDILFFGDIVGRPGRRAVQWYLASLAPENRPDVVIGNVENASHGFGLTEKNYNELLSSGLDILTGGNHIWDRKDLFDYIDRADRLLRPANFPQTNLGRGAGVFEVKGLKIGVLNLIGQAFMGNYNSPWEQLDDWVPRLLAETPVVFIDCHAEASAEKMSLAWEASRLGASVFVGTHTHVQTADERLMHDHLGYLTDAGFCGAYDSVIGMVIDPALERIRTFYPVKLEVPETTLVQVNACRFTVNTQTGACTDIQRVRVIQDLKAVSTSIR